MGIQNPHPRFSWSLDDSKTTAAQVSYRLLVSDSEKALSENIGNLWDSGTVMDGKSVSVPYVGESLKSKTVYNWQVTVVCQDGYCEKSPVSRFETGIFSNEEWQGQWISHSQPQKGRSQLLRTVIRTSEKPNKARLYISGLGYYYLYINGKPVSDRKLEPGWTAYSKTVLYSAYAIEDFLQPGENVIGVELGEGWYGHQHTSLLNFAGLDESAYHEPRLLMELDVQTPDGKMACVCASQSEGWSCSFGGIVDNNIYDGEVYNEWLHPYGWESPDYAANQTQWLPVALAEAPGGKLRCQIMPPIRVTESLFPFSVVKRTGYRYVVDFGQNFSGWVRLEIKNAAGKRIQISYAEILDESGSVNQANLRGARCQDIWIPGGSGTEVYEPRFTYHGFRYAEILLDERVELVSVIGQVVHTDVTRKSNFTCSNPVLNNIYKAIIWTERSNLHSIPTDCPQRDERMAWLNDVTVRCEEAIYNFDMMLFFDNWLQDVADEQLEGGSLPDTAPYIYGGNPSYHISSCVILIPWFLHLHYDDTQILEKWYPTMKKYVEFLISQASDGLIHPPYSGEWAPPAEFCDNTTDWGAVPINIPPEMVTSGYLYYDCAIMEKVAALLGRSEDISMFASMAEKVKAAINSTYYREESGCYIPDSQGNNVFPLFLGIAPHEDSVATHLVRDIVENDMHLSTGNQMTKYLFPVLDKIGHSELAYRMASDETYPSLGYMLKNGATTIWERWENSTGPGMNSHNHPMNAAYTVWLFKTLAGIRLEERDRQTDQSQVVIAPVFLRELDYVEASVGTVKGRISCSWKREGNEICLKVSLPWNMTALLRLPQEIKEINGDNEWVFPDRKANTYDTITSIV